MSRGKRKRKCTKKLSFPTLTRAYAAMREIPAMADGRMPQRAYWCGQHKAYHLTSRLPAAVKRKRW